MEERIITLGNSNSGKSNYMGLSLSYICRYWKDLPMLGINSNFINNVNQSEDKMQSGIWLDKTQDPTLYHFKAKLPRRNLLATPEEHEFFVEDWPGEDFEALGNSEKGTSEPGLKSKRKEPKALFKETIKNSDSYVIFLDGEKLKNKGVESNVQRSLSALQDLLKDPSLPLSDRRFAFVVTKADVLEKLEEFTHDSKDGLDITKLKQLVTSKYTTFFNFLDWHKLEYRIFAVSCVPKKDNRQVDPVGGTKPTAKWSLKDMESCLVHVDCSFLLQLITLGLAKSERKRHHDQLAPFRWLFRYNGD